eukprot:jgi/Mesvir1/24691/Mv21979-RA.3
MYWGAGKVLNNLCKGFVRLAIHDKSFLHGTTIYRCAGKALDNLCKGGRFTLFAPTSAAFERFARVMPEDIQRVGAAMGVFRRVAVPAAPPDDEGEQDAGAQAALDGSMRQLLGELLADHVLPVKLLSTDFPPPGTAVQVRAISGHLLSLASQHGGGLRANGKQVVQRDVLAAKGVVHLIDEVVVSAEFQARVRELMAAVGKGGAAGGAAAASGKKRWGEALTTLLGDMDDLVEPEDAVVADGSSDDGVDGGGGGDHLDDERLPDGLTQDASSTGGEEPREGGLGGSEEEGRHKHKKRKKNASGGSFQLGLGKGKLCSGRGFPNGPGGSCVCPILYTGLFCETTVRVRNMTELKPYSGNIAFNANHLSQLKFLQINTAFKMLEILPKLTPPVMAQISDLLPPDDVLGGQFFATCAIVGSSGSLMRYKNGALIDSHEMVLRFNAAPTKGYEEFVGHKTTIRLSNSEHLGWSEEGDGMVVHHLRSKGFLYKMLLYNKVFPQKRPVLVDPQFTQYVASSLDFIPSSGYFAVLMALNMCGSTVQLFGFHGSNRHGSRHHYYNTEVPSNVQRDDTEFTLLANLAAAGLVHFSEPCVLECHASKEACEECMNHKPLEEIAELERWTALQKKLNAQREAAWQEALKWDWDISKKYTWDDDKGLVPAVRKAGGRKRPQRYSD